MDIKWTDTDPNTGLKRFVKAEHFAGKWQFACRRERRGVWEAWKNPSRDMWETLLDSIERRLPRREGIELDEVKKVRAILAKFKDIPTV